MAAVAAVCVILGSAAVSERGAKVPEAATARAASSGSGRVNENPGQLPRSETVVAFGPNKVGAESPQDRDPVGRKADHSPGRPAAPASLSTAQPEGANDERNASASPAGRPDATSGREVPSLQDASGRSAQAALPLATMGQPSRAKADVLALRRYIAAKHQATLRHTRLLGRPAFPVRYRWKTTRSIPYLKHLARRWQVRAHTAWLVVVWVREPENAIRFVFGPDAEAALAVARCESGLSIWARNGQFLGLFQMGGYARSRYGHDWTALGQARAAYAYFKDAGWSPWQCRPDGGLRW